MSDEFDFTPPRDPLDRFDGNTRERVTGLMHLGHLTDTIDFCGHTFTLRTLYADETLAAAMAAQAFRDSLREAEAFTWSQVALALVDVDGADDFCPPVGPNKTEFAKARFRWLTSNFFPPTLEYLWMELARLNVEARDLIEEVRDLSNRSLDTLSPSPDSSTGPASSNVLADLLG